MAYGTTGTGVVNGSSSGGTVNWANGVTGTSTDRALGFLSPGGFTSPRSIIFPFQNKTGSVVSSIAVSFNHGKFRSGTRVFDWTFFQGATPTALVANTDGNQSYTIKPPAGYEVSSDGITFSSSLSLTPVIGSVTSAYDTWAAGCSLTGASALPTADPDNDVLNNHNEYAFGTNPTLSNASLMSATTSAGNMTVTWIERNSGFTGAVGMAGSAVRNLSYSQVSGPLRPAGPTNFEGDKSTFTTTPHPPCSRTVSAIVPRQRLGPKGRGRRGSGPLGPRVG